MGERRAPGRLFNALAVASLFLKAGFALVVYRCRCSEPGRWRCDRGHHSAPACGGLDRREGEPPEGWGNPAGVPRPLGRKDVKEFKS